MHVCVCVSCVSGLCSGRPGLPFMILVLGSSRILLESTEPTRDPVWTGAANTVPWNGADELQLQLMTVPPLPPADADAASDMEGEYGGRAVVRYVAV